MRVLVTGSSGHLGRALVRTLLAGGSDVVGLDVVPAPTTTVLGSIIDARCVRRSVDGADAIIHTATLHRPHVRLRSRADFVETNVRGTLTLLEAAVDADVGSFVFTSTTSAFGRALTPPPGAPAAWISEKSPSLPRDIYGTTKASAEALCEVVYRDHGMPCVILRTSRFFVEPTDLDERLDDLDDANVKINELLHRRVDIADAVAAHLLAVKRAPALGFALYVVSATTPFSRDDVADLRADAPSVVCRLFPEYESTYAALGWRMSASIDRVYVNARARRELGWSPRHNFAGALDSLAGGAARISVVVSGP